MARAEEDADEEESAVDAGAAEAAGQWMSGVSNVRPSEASPQRRSSPWALLDVEGSEEEEGEERRCDREWEEDEEQDWYPPKEPK